MLDVVLKAILGSYFLFVISIPLSSLLFNIYADYDAKRVYLVCGQLLAGLCILCWRDIRLKIINFNLPYIWVSVFIGLGSLSAFISHHLGSAFLELFSFINLFLIALLVAGLVINVNKNGLVILVSLFSAFVLLIHAFLFVASYFSALISGGTLDMSTLAPGFSNRRFLNQLQVWLMPLVALFFVVRSERVARYKSVAWLVLCLNMVILIFCEARGALLSLLVSWLLLLYLFPQRLKFFLKHTVYLLGLAIVLFFIMSYSLPEPIIGSQGLFSTSTSFRLEIWAAVSGLIADNPMLGVGPMQYAAISNEFSLSHPHNSVLQIAVEWGVPALIILSSVCVLGISAWFKMIAKTEDGEIKNYRIFLLCSLCAASVYSLFSGVIVMPLSQFVGAVVIGLMVGEYQATIAAGSEAIKKKGKKESLLVLIVLVAVVSYICIASMDFMKRYAGGYSYIQNMSNTGPRFWQHGGVIFQNKDELLEQ